MRSLQFHYDRLKGYSQWGFEFFYSHDERDGFIQLHMGSRTWTLEPERKRKWLT